MIAERLDSANENVSKYVFDFGTAIAEAVLYKYPTFEERTVICCSTQSGCPVGCRFCGAGDYFVRSLTADEIITQVQYLLSDRNIDSDKIRSCQVMFMSMGEPMLNIKNLCTAISGLHKLYPRFALLASTSAPRVDYARFRAVSVATSTVGLQFSIHESTDEARNKLIPFKDKLTLTEIAEEGGRWATETSRRPFINYCAHEENTSWDDAARLACTFNPDVWESTVSVICEREESVAAANERQRELASDFMEKLIHYGFSARCFDPAGQDDIGGGCGQLWATQKWMRNNPALPRPSTGNGMPTIHTPR